MIFYILFPLLCIFYLLNSTFAIRLTGEWDIRDKYKFLTKFGFQKTQVDELTATRGYIYGNIVPKSQSIDVKNLGTLVVVDGDYILDIHGNSSVPWWRLSGFNTTLIRNGIYPSSYEIESARCQAMFSRIQELAWHKTCSPKAKMDFLRSIPCPKNKRCEEEDDSTRLVDDSKFTYTIQDTIQPRYWYLVMAACYLNETTCKWEATSVPKVNSTNPFSTEKLEYDIWLVNGDPKLKDFNKFEHQFSFEDHDTLEIYLVFMGLYLLLVCAVEVKLRCVREPFILLLRQHLWLSAVWTILMNIHLAVCSITGLGISFLCDTGMVLSRWADSYLLLLILATAEQWFTDPFGAVLAFYNQYKCRIFSLKNSDQLPSVAKNSKSYFISLLLIFIFFQSGLFIWALLDQDPVIDVLVWNTMAGCILLALRFTLIFWFLSILRSRQRCNTPDDNLINKSMSTLGINRHDRAASTSGNGVTSQTEPGVELVHFAAGYLLWLLTLPMIVFIAESSVSALWRKKTIITVTLCCDYVAAAVYTYLLISTRNAVLCLPS